MRAALAWSPAALFVVGAVFTGGVHLQRSLALRVPLDDAVPKEIAGRTGTDIQLSDNEVRVAGVTAYLMRSYSVPDGDSTAFAEDGPVGAARSASPFSVYVGFYASQMQGRTIHSPKNCLPGAGWEALASSTADVETPGGTARVNRYLLQNRDSRALVLYWYQGRGRVEANEYLVKWNLLRDAAVRQRSDEALVRIVVPVGEDVAEAERTAVGVAAAVLPSVWRALPE